MFDRHVGYKVEGGIATAILDGPHAMNTFSEEIFHDLFDVVRAANDDDSVRVLVVTSGGQIFSSGGDLSWE